MGKRRDTETIQKIINLLTPIGVKAHQFGDIGEIGEDAHLDILIKDKNVESNALIVEIAGGACAGSIYEKGSSWYKKLLGPKRRDIIVKLNTSKWILKDLDFLPKGKYDEFSEKNWPGLEHPDWYIYANGYNFIEDITIFNLQPVADFIKEEARIRPVSLSKRQVETGIKNANTYYKKNGRPPKTVGGVGFVEFTRFVMYYGLNYSFCQFEGYD
ncbi:MAG: hypothetical protein A4E27_00521 [Methanobacterium sp. PtaU1.Bin242]|nr:MAG: hypothetical protein A4E27_00521 [Methanobacterium sp. PtaU1.Bin242]